ncbi:MAG TPA: hypothetical protein VLE89_06025 [Chlamydiales bacterium]|nr:hypothetical protein [Chlamydiales bacterium]
MSVPKVPFQIDGNRLKFYEGYVPITKAIAFWANGRQIQILSKTTVPDNHLRMDLMFETADDVQRCAEVLNKDKIRCYDLSDSSYTDHFEIFPDRVAQILVPIEPILLKINPDQIGQIHEIAAKARIVCSGPKAAELLDEKINGMKRAKLGKLVQSLSRACRETGDISNEMAINWGTSIEAINKMRRDEWGVENDAEYLTPDELAIVRQHFPSNDAPAEAPDPHEIQFIEVAPCGNRTSSTAVLVTDKGEQALFYGAIPYQESYE